MPLLTELGSRGSASAINMPLQGQRLDAARAIGNPCRHLHDMIKKQIAGFTALVVLTTGLLQSEQTIAAELPSTGLVLWLDAAAASSLTLTNGLVDSWRNQAPGFQNQFKSRKDHYPRYLNAAESGLRPALRFDGRADVLADGQFNHPMKKWTLAVVAAPFPSNTGGGLVTGCSAHGNDYDPGFTVDLFQTTSRFNSLSVEGAGRLAGQVNQLTASFLLGGLHVIVVERDQEEIRVRVDGEKQMTRPVRPATTQVGALRIGARMYDGKERQYFSGLISQVLLYERILPPAEIAMIEATLKVGDKERQAGEALAASPTATSPLNRAAVVKPAKLLEQWPAIEVFLKTPAAQRVINTIENPLVGLPIRTDLRQAIALSVEHLTSLFDRDRADEPFFYSNRREDGIGEMHHSLNIGIPHVVGRCLLGILAAEEATGLPIQSDGVEVLRRYCKQSFDDPNHLNSYVDPQRDNQRFIEFHSMREGLYGLVCLIAQRDDPWARAEAERMLQSLEAMTDPEGRWSADLAYQKGFAKRLEGVSIMNAARMVDPLLKYHRLTKSALALKLAAGYARQGLKTGFTEDGHFAPMACSSGHIHSITSSLSGIIDYAIFAADQQMLDQCLRVMRAGVPEYFSSWGWGDEVMPEHPADVIGRGEINQTGDIIRAALLLGAAVDSSYYDLAERFLRGMLLSAQHRERELSRILKDALNPPNDSQRNVLRRSIGGYAMQFPNDRMSQGDWPISTLDITSGAVHAMSECWNSMIQSTGNVTRVNLLFDCRNKYFEIFSHLPLCGQLNFIANTNNVLMVRIPPWVDAKTIRLSVNREVRPVELKSGYIVIDRLKPGAQGCVTFDVPCKVEKESVDGTEYTTTWVGNQLINISPRGTESPLPF